MASNRRKNVGLVVLLFAVIHGVARVRADLVDLSYFAQEYSKVMALRCERSGECNDREDSDDPQLHRHFEAYWRESTSTCAQENEPCGHMWGLCCRSLDCQLVDDGDKENDESSATSIGLCSQPDVTYI